MAILSVDAASPHPCDDAMFVLLRSLSLRM